METVEIDGGAEDHPLRRPLMGSAKGRRTDCLWYAGRQNKLLHAF